MVKVTAIFLSKTNKPKFYIAITLLIADMQNNWNPKCEDSEEIQPTGNSVFCSNRNCQELILISIM